MGKTILSLIVISLLFIDPICHAQTSARLTDPRLEIKDNILHITYDLLNSDPSEKFNIAIDIKDEHGNTMDANTLIGDLGNDVGGGSDKRVTWNLEADNVFINAYVDVKITASIIPPPAQIIPETEEEVVQEIVNDDDLPNQDMMEENEVRDEGIKESRPENEVNNTELPTEGATHSFNRAGIVIQSLPLPGLGLSRVTGNPHWIKGVAGYGCLIGSVVLNRISVSTFNSISDIDDVDDVTDAFNSSVRQDNMSEVLAYAGLGIWITDVIWTVIGTSDLKTRPLFSQSRGFSMRSHIDPLSNAPMISLRYKF